MRGGAGGGPDTRAATVPIAAAIVAAYFVGSFPTGFLAARVLRGVDLRHEGSGNVGATNVYRTLGGWWAIAVAFVDMGKGAIAAGVLGPASGLGEAGCVALGLVAVVGHMFPVWLRFHGGKGVATSAGMLFALAPAPVLVAGLVWGGVLGLSKRASVASIAAALTLPPLVYVTLPDHAVTQGLVLALSLLVVAAHQSNIRRMLRGQEPPTRRRG